LFVLCDVGWYFGMGLGSVVNVFNFEVIVLGGIFCVLYFVVCEDMFEVLMVVVFEVLCE